MNALVGYTGFVGSNIYSAGEFVGYNSKNIEDAYGTNPDLLIYAGLRAEKYLANQVPEKDMESIIQAEENICRINPRKLVFISTIDVFKTPRDVDENSEVDTENLHAYGYNRYQMELWVRKEYADALIIRLPGLFGKNIKKNFIHDYMNRVPQMLTETKMVELTQVDAEICKYYTIQDNGFYKANTLTGDDRIILGKILKKVGFSALNFTDSRSVYQFYDLSRLWDDIQIALKAGIQLWHPATEPVSAGEVYKYLCGEEFTNELNATPAYYDYKTIYGSAFGGKNGYICSKNEVLKNIKDFVGGQQ